jgi:uncharacterized protein (TIGR03435 family)
MLLFAVPCQGQEVKLFHPDGQLPSYEVATIKPADPDQPWRGTTLRRYIQSAYGAGALWNIMINGSSDIPLVHVIGGPAWIDKDVYQINGKPPDQLRLAMDKMAPEEKTRQTEMMQQSLLAERFHLRAHIETREMTVYELVTAKSGLKIKPVDPPPPPNGDAPNGGAPKPGAPGMTQLGMMLNGTRIVTAHATSMDRLIGLLRAQADVGGRPIVDKTGFTGYFDIDGLRFSGAPMPQSGQSTAESDAPAISTALEEKLGLRLVPRKEPVEVVVIDSIDRPTEN